MKHKSPSPDYTGLTHRDIRRIKITEILANVGLVVVALSLFAPLINLSTVAWLPMLKWVFAAGAVLYTIARALGVVVPGESMRLRRMRRMEVWGGICICAGAFFWFWNEGRLGPYAGPLALLRDTILFSLAGAVIEVIAAWTIYAAQKKASRSDESGKDKKGGGLC